METHCNNKGSGRKRSRSGTTIIEVMLALVILTILAVAMTTGMRYPRFQTVSSAHKQAAIHVATEALEETVSLGYATVSADVGSGAVSLGDLSTRYSMNGSVLSGTRTVVVWPGDTSGGPNPTLLITVSVGFYGGATPVVLETLMGPGR